MRSRTLLAAVAVSILAVVTLATPANASQPYRLSTEDYTSEPGWVTTHGTITFSASNAVSVKGKVTDHCPSNGYGGWVFMKVEFINGNQKMPFVGKSEGECTSPADKYRWKHTWPLGSVKRVRAELWEMNADQIHFVRYGKWKYNPHAN